MVPTGSPMSLETRPDAMASASGAKQIISASQRLQYPLIKEYTLKYSRIPDMT